MSALVTGINCEPAGREIGLGLGVTPEPTHDCPGSWNMRPGLLGGEQCDCECHLTPSPVPHQETP